ncbi:MAG: hypothetical protein JO261_00070 [Alphaproteobacteria bacterium]|nr:hypothetical protein [Alphaproteobacteria bacterium]
MCNSDHHGFTRRSFAGLALAGATSLALPRDAWAADTWRKEDVVLDALCLMCIDYRLPSASVSAFDNVAGGYPGPGPRKFDLVALAGASLAATSETTFLPSAAGFWQQFGAAWALHSVQKLIVLDHMECGAFNVQFNNGVKLPYDRELELHKQQMRRLKQILPQHARAVGAPETMPVEFWIYLTPDDVTHPPTHLDDI